MQGLSDVPSAYVSHFLTMYLCRLQWTHLSTLKTVVVVDNTQISKWFCAFLTLYQPSCSFAG